jgi:hypothetical protein
MNTDCAICYTEINASTGITTLECSHSYHLKCIATWIINHNSCPCCRKTLNQYESLEELQVSNISITSIDYYSDDWIIDAYVPELQLPPNIIRMHYDLYDSPLELNPNADPFIPASSELVTAATKIVAAVRGWLTRRRLIP